MGTWGVGSFDNDPAIELRERFEEWVDGLKPIGYDAAIDRFFRHWGDAVNYGDSITNSEIIALAAIHIERKLALPIRLRKAVVHAISRELLPEVLQSWEDPEQRAVELEAMLRELNERKVDVPRPYWFRDPALIYGSIESAKRDLLRRCRQVRNSLGSRYIVTPKVLPRFLKTLDRFMNYGVAERDYNIAEQARIERCLMLAWYVGMVSGFTEEEIEKLFERIVDSQHHR